MNSNDAEVYFKDGQVEASKRLNPNNKMLFFALFGHLCLFAGLSFYNLFQVMVLGGFKKKKQTLFNWCVNLNSF